MGRANVIGFTLIFVSLGLLLPGLTRPVMTLIVKVEFLGLSSEIVHEQRSIVGSIKHLYETGNAPVAALILLFGVLIPIAKAILLLTAILIDRFQRKYEIYQIINFISKWAMADVFVVAILVAFLTAQATVSVTAQLEDGFYFFVGYVLTSVASLHFIKIDQKNAGRAARMAVK
ncbi:MAG TPA: paraquat-inducible protein A [Pseudomonadales bacterium]|nr:paraquat-inducible protein A [Pseudomonadales bacterium]